MKTHGDVTWTIALLATLALASVPATLDARPQARNTHALVGEWTLNPDLSDKAPAQRGRAGDPSGRAGGRGRGGPGGGVGGGGFGGGFGGGRSGSGAGPARGRPDPAQMERMREVMAMLTNPPDRLTIVETESMVILTAGDGSVRRLAPTGKKIKDESTGIEQKTRWDADTLVNEITGTGDLKVTETYAVDVDTHRLKVTVKMDGGPRRGQTLTRVYDATP